MELLNKINNPSDLSIKDKIKFLSKDIFFYGGFRAIFLLVPFLTVPFLTRYFSIEDYGLYDSLAIFSSFITTFLVFGQDSALARWFYNVDNIESKRRVITESLLIQLLFIVIIIPTLIFFSKNISHYYLESSHYQLLIILIVIQSIFGVFNNFTVNTLKWTYNRKKYAYISITNPIMLLLSLFLLYYLSLSLTKFIIINIFVSFFISLLGLYFCKDWIKFSSKFYYIKNLLTFAWPFGLICILLAFSPTLERKVLLDNFDFNSLGLYALAFKIAMIISVIDSVFQMAWGPFSLSIYKQSDSNKVYNIVFKSYFFFFIAFLFIIFIFSNLLVSIFGTVDYINASVIILPLAFSLFFNGLSGISGIGITLSMKSYLMVFPHFISIVLFILFTFLFIPYLGLIGIAFSSLFSNFIKLLIISYISRRVYSNIKICFSRVVLYSMFFFVFLYISKLFYFSLITSIFLFLFFYLLIVYSLLNKEEKNFFKKKLEI